MINQLKIKNNEEIKNMEGVNEMNLNERARKYAEEKIEGREDKVLYTHYVADFFKREKTKEQIEEFRNNVWTSMYKILLLNDWVVDDRQFFTEEIGWCLSLLDYSFEGLIENKEEFRNLEGKRLEILKTTWSELDNTIKEFGVDCYKGSISLEPGTGKLLINHFINDVCLGFMFFLEPIDFRNLRSTTLLKAIAELKVENFKIYQGFTSKNTKKFKYSYLTAMSNVVIEEDSDIVKVELF